MGCDVLESIKFFFGRAGSVPLQRERVEFFSLERVQFFFERVDFFLFTELNISCLDGVELDFLIFLREKVEFLLFSLKRVEFFFF